MKPVPRFVLGLCALLPTLAISPVSAGTDGVTFHNLAEDPGAGLSYEHARTAAYAQAEALRLQSLVEPLGPDAPMIGMTGGLPGVALLDYDGDGDLDIYVTNGPGAPSKLFSSELVDSGDLRYVDRAAEAGVEATDQSSTGACFGDVDNDGDPDLLVLGYDEPNRFYVNQGDGTFEEDPGSALAVDGRKSIGCSFGDVDGDGLLDVVVGNAVDFSMPPPPGPTFFDNMDANQLFRNLGGGAFEDVSVAAGIEALGGLPPSSMGRTVTWATAVVDVDLDGDQDIVFGDDQGPYPIALFGGFDFGFVHVLINDGTGHFTDLPVLENPFSSSSWMGLSFGDFDCDGNLDTFVSNFGDYMFDVLGLPYIPGLQTTRPLLGRGDGTFADPYADGVPNASVFGWGNAVADLDNDGDQDVVYHGGLELGLLILADNPGAVLLNDGCGSFTPDLDALRRDYSRRNVHGVAAGDLNADGFPDVVSVSSVNIPEAIPLLPSPASYGTAFDDTAYFASLYVPTPDGLVWSGLDYDFGDVTVEISSADTGNGWARVHVQGSVGLTAGGAVNRDGIGAVIAFTPKGGETVLVPVTGGSSHTSQHALTRTLGLGDAPWGTLEVLWPGGARNRLYGVRPGDDLVLPEIPCDFTTDRLSRASYRRCVTEALDDLRAAGVVSPAYAGRLRASALRALAEQ